MPETVELREYVCPECGQGTKSDSRFVAWCIECGHGADPYPPKPLGKRGQRDAERERRRSTRLFESLRTAPDLRPTSATGVAVTVLSGFVHLIGVALLVLPILLVVNTHGALLPFVVLVLCLMTFWAVRPRLVNKRLDSEKFLTRSTAPQLYALLDKCAAELGCKVPDVVRFDQRFNAATGRAGVKQRSFLAVGVPLWTVLSGPERIALLGHELAHQVNGDTTHGLWAASARRSIVEWTKILNPRQTAFERANNALIQLMWRGTGQGLGAMLAPVVMAILFAPFFLIALGCRALLVKLDLYCGQRAEYLADELGARLAGSEAAHGLIAKLALHESVVSNLTAARSRYAMRRQEEEGVLWSNLATYIASIPETELQRRQIVDRLRNARTDRSHPANHLRSALIRDRAQLPGVLELSAEDWAAVDAELAPVYVAAARGFLRSV